MATRPASDLDTLLLGTPFRAVARLGEGGMGEIYEAMGPFGGEPVVVKMLRADFTEQADLVERLRREGEMLRWITHPNIVVSHGHGTTAAGRPYVVLERLIGATLRQELIRRGPLPVREAVDATRQLLSALACVHDAGIVHRDIKPGNVMLCNAAGDVRVKLIDFGVAKLSGEARGLVAPLALPTREGVCLGTPRYVSPEQVSGVDVDGRSDIYAAGLLLYTLVAGRGPFDDIVGVEHLLAAHLGCEPAPPSRFMTTPLAPALEAVILRAIAKRPGDRFDDAGAFGRALGRAFALAPESRRAPRSRRISLPVPYGSRPREEGCRICAVAPLPVPLWDFSEAMIPVTWSETLTRVLGAARHAPKSERNTTRAGPKRAESAPECGRGAARAAKEAYTPSRTTPPKTGYFRASISRRGVLASAVLFFAVAGGLAMWFVR